VKRPSARHPSSAPDEALSTLAPEFQRFALLLQKAVGDVAHDQAVSEAEVLRFVFRSLQVARIHERRAAHARRELADVLAPSLDDVAPVPRATIEQARRLAALRAALLAGGAWTTAALAEAHDMTPNNARQWIHRHRKAGRIFTVTHEGEALVPAFLMDERLEPRPAAQAPIRALRAAGEDGWGMWAWFVSPSGWLGGQVPADLLDTDPGGVAQAAERRATAAA
jgi:hypothetical protein